MAVAYDLVLEDHILAHQGAKRRQRPFAREVAEMVRYAVGYQSRAFVTFGTPIPLERHRSRVAPRRDGSRAPDPRHASAASTRCCRPRSSPPRCGRRSTRRELEARADAIIDELRRPARNLGVTSGREAVEAGAPSRSRRATSSTSNAADASACANGRCCATTRARSSTCSRARGGPAHPLMFDTRLEDFFPHSRRQPTLKRLASRYGMRQPDSFARRFIAGETVDEAIAAARASKPTA